MFTGGSHRYHVFGCFPRRLNVRDAATRGRSIRDVYPFQGFVERLREPNRFEYVQGFDGHFSCHQVFGYRHLARLDEDELRKPHRLHGSSRGPEIFGIMRVHDDEGRCLMDRETQHGRYLAEKPRGSRRGRFGVSRDYCGGLELTEVPPRAGRGFGSLITEGTLAVRLGGCTRVYFVGARCGGGAVSSG